eukprot:2333516-Rhodomonas_salina.1
MIEFEKKSFGFNRAFWTTIVGSSFPKAFPAAVLSTGIHVALMFGLSDKRREELKLEHPYAVGMIFAAIGFLIVYRATHAYNRMGDGAGWVFHMESRLFDSLMQALSFHRQSEAYKSGSPESKLFLSRLYHLHSLALAMNCLSLRRDGECNVQRYNTTDVGSINSPSSLKRPSESPRNYRPSNPFSWFYYAASMRSSRQVRGLYYSKNKLDVYGGVNARELQYLQECGSCKSRALLAMQWLTDFISTEQQRGSFGSIPPPVIARLYQWLSEASLGFNKALRVVDVPFPFIIAQIAEFAVISLVPLVPVLHVSFVRESAAMGSVLTFITCLIFIGLYESARDVEDPFVYEPNDLPLAGICHRFNECIVAIETHPTCPWDDSPAPLARPQDPAGVHQVVTISESGAGLKST